MLQTSDFSLVGNRFVKIKTKSTQEKHGPVEVEAADDKALQYINNHSQQNVLMHILVRIKRFKV